MTLLMIASILFLLQKTAKSIGHGRILANLIEQLRVTEPAEVDVDQRLLPLGPALGAEVLEGKNLGLDAGLGGLQEGGTQRLNGLCASA